MKNTEPKHVIYDMDSVYDGVVRQAQRYGEKARYYYRENGEEKTLTYNQMLEHVNYISSGLDSMGYSGATVVMTGESHPDYVAVYDAVVSIGGIIVPLDKDITNDQFSGFVNVTETKVVFYMASLNDKISDKLGEMTNVEKFICIASGDLKLPEDDRFMRFEDFFEIGKKAYESGNRAAENHVVDLDAVCAILYTSGTTGTSKGVMLSQNNLVTATIDSDYIMAVMEDDVFVSVLPFHHAYEFVCAQFALPNTGATTAINDSIKNVLRNFQKFKPTALVLVPLFVETLHKRIWAEIEKKGKTKTVKNAIKVSNALRKIGIDRRRVLFKDILAAFGGNLKLIICGGAPLRADLLDDFDAFGIEICEGYGITECAPLISANPVTWRKYHSVGLKVPHMEVKIDKENEGDETGEILAKGPAVFKGYYKNPEATEAAFTEDGWFRTGDIGYVDKDNFIFITGRKKNVIILSNGKNIFPEELEEYITASNLVSECVVVGRKNEAGETSIWALVYPDYEVLKDKTKEEIESAIRAEIDSVNKKLPVYKHIPNVEIRETEFEKNTTRKIIRYKIK